MIFLLELNVQPTKIKPKGGKHALVFIGFCGEWSCMLINAWIFEIYYGSLGHSIYYLMHLFLMHQLIGQELVKKTQPNHEMSYCLHCNASETMLFHFRSSCGCMEHWCIKKISKPHKWINLSQAKCAKLVHRSNKDFDAHTHIMHITRQYLDHNMTCQLFSCPLVWLIYIYY